MDLFRRYGVNRLRNQYRAQSGIKWSFLASLFSVFLLCSWISSAVATGMQPDTTAVLIFESLGEATVRVKNTDRTPALLYVTLEDLPEESQSVPLIVTPPVARVEPGETQLVRFILDDTTPCPPVQQLKRVIFEGIPFVAASKATAPVHITIRQNLPVVIHPKGLASDIKPWERLVWSFNSERQLQVTNPSSYVVRLSHQVVINPGRHIGFLPNTYILPGHTVLVSKLPPFSRTKMTTAPSVCFEPVSAYGQVVASYKASIKGA